MLKNVVEEVQETKQVLNVKIDNQESKILGLEATKKQLTSDILDRDDAIHKLNETKTA